MILSHPNINKPPKELERRLSAALEIDLYLKMPGVRVDQTLSTVSISFPTRTAADEFFKVVRRGVRT